MAVKHMLQSAFAQSESLGQQSAWHGSAKTHDLGFLRERNSSVWCSVASWVPARYRADLRAEMIANVRECVLAPASLTRFRNAFHASRDFWVNVLVAGRCVELKVLWAVVEFVAVAMVDNLSGHHRAPKRARHHDAMLQRIPALASMRVAWSPHQSVAGPCERLPIVPSRIASATMPMPGFPAGVSVAFSQSPRRRFTDYAKRLAASTAAQLCKRFGCHGVTNDTSMGGALCAF
jgi:hypothetical protein